MSFKIYKKLVHKRLSCGRIEKREVSAVPVKVKVKKNKKLKALKIIAAVLVAALCFLAVFRYGVQYKHRSALWMPDYEMQDISEVIKKDTLTDADYELVFNQTGLTKEGVDACDDSQILSVQQSFFEKRELVAEEFAPFTCCDATDTIAETVKLEDGDIIVTSATHLSFFELGHAAIVVDAEKGEVLNAIGYDQKSCIEPVSEMTCRPNFVVLRPNLSAEKRKAAAEYAKKELIDLQYSVSFGFFGNKFTQTPSLTNCGHIIWYAYKKQGIDIDSNGGPLVMPSDILASDELTALQVYGIEPSGFKR